MQREYEVVVLGIGNVLWADEGFGVRALEALHAGFVFGPGVRLLDGGTLGLSLFDYVTAARRVLVLDAIDFGLAPGTLRVLRDAEVPAWSRAKLSPHQTGFNDVLALAALQGRAPEAVAVVGVQPVELQDFGGSLREPVRLRIPDAVAAACGILAEWGADPRPRTTELPAEALNAGSLALEAYERERPAADDACRIGDPRLLATLGR